jgi:ABC-type glycerol-3-phosphate transport system substrate-binding protein
VPTQYVYVDVEPLFPDVELAMRNGLFYDVSKLYDADETLKKDSLNKKIMDSGVVDGKRFVLPLRYDIPVIYAENEYLERVGLDVDALNGDILSIMEAVYKTEAPYLAGGVLYDGLSVFPSLIDYNSSTLSPDAKTLTAFLEYYQKLKSLLGEAYVDYDKESPDAKSVVLAEKNRIF